MNIRKMTIDDYQQVYDLWMACDGVGLNDIDDSRQGIERFLKRNPETCFVTEEDGKVVGVGTMADVDLFIMQRLILPIVAKKLVIILSIGRLRRFVMRVSQKWRWWCSTIMMLRISFGKNKASICVAI